MDQPFGDQVQGGFHTTHRGLLGGGAQGGIDCAVLARREVPLERRLDQRVEDFELVPAELPGGVAEATGPVEVLADVDPARAQAALRHEGVGGADVGGGDLVRLLARLLRRPDRARGRPDHAAHLWTWQRSEWASQATWSP